MTFVPALGTRVETNQRLQVALRSIRRGDVELPLQRDIAPEPQGTTAVYRRSADVGERYEVRADGDRCEGTLRLVDGELELSLPAAFVDAAATGDYLVVWATTQSTTSANVVGRFYHRTTGLGPTVLLGSAGSVQRPKVAYHAYQNRFRVIWEKSGSCERADGAQRDGVPAATPRLRPRQRSACSCSASPARRCRAALAPRSAPSCSG